VLPVTFRPPPRVVWLSVTVNVLPVPTVVSPLSDTAPVVVLNVPVLASRLKSPLPVSNEKSFLAPFQPFWNEEVPVWGGNGPLLAE